jgi:hypothetical protein
MGAFAARMGQDKNKNSASGLARFLVLFCQSHTTGIIRAHPSHPWFTDKVQRSTLDSRRSSQIKLTIFRIQFALPNTPRHWAELMADWNLLKAGQCVEPIKPLN